MAAALPILYYIFRSKPSPVEDAAATRKSGKTLSDDTDKARAEEEARRQAEAKRHAAELEAIKKKYEEARSKLNAAEQAEADRIVKEHGSDPVALAQELSKVTGFKIIMPKD